VALVLTEAVWSCQRCHATAVSLVALIGVLLQPSAGEKLLQPQDDGQSIATRLLAAQVWDTDILIEYISLLTVMTERSAP